MKILKYTETHVYILTDDQNQLKLINPGHTNKNKAYKWLKVIASDFDKMMNEKNKKI
jgi:gamma-glutamylcysteine synthetase